MTINFDDGSFISFMPDNNDDNKITLVICGRKNKYETTMSSSVLTKDQVSKITSFLLEWADKK